MVIVVSYAGSRTSNIELCDIVHTASGLSLFSCSTRILSLPIVLSPLIASFPTGEPPP